VRFMRVSLTATADVPDTPHKLGRSVPRLSKRTGIDGLSLTGLILLAAAVALVLLLRGDDDDGSSTETLNTLTVDEPASGAPAATPFTLSYPENWSEVSNEELGSAASDTLATLRRDGRSGVLVVAQQQTPKNLDLEQLGEKLGKEIKRGISDAREVSARPTHLPAGDAFVYSFVRERAGTVHTVVVVPSGGVTYILNSVIPSGDNAAAQEAGEIIRTLEFE
jgi:hypothetical protein